MQQFISSGISAEPPGKYARKMFKRFLHTKFDLANGIRMQMEILPNGELFLPTQNFLCLVPFRPDKSRKYTQQYKGAMPLYLATLVGVPLSGVPLGSPLPKPIYLEFFVACQFNDTT